jgi:hypothetical protein
MRKVMNERVKKSYAAIVCISMLSSSFIARADEPVRWGIGAGMNFATIALPTDRWPADSALYQTPNKGLTISAFMEAQISDLAYFVPQLAFVEKGTRVENISFTAYTNGQYSYVPRGSITVDATFIELSTRFMSKLGPSWFKICPSLGPVLGLNLSSQATYEYPSRMPQDPNMRVDKNQFVAPVELGLQFGLGLEISTSARYSYLVNCGYSLGLSDFGGIYGFPSGKLSSRGAQVSVGMSFTP